MRAIAIACATLVLAACAGGSEVSGDRRVVGNSTVTFTVRPAKAELGRPVRFQLRITNNSGREDELTFATGQRYDFWVASDTGDLMWRWSDDRVFTQAIETVAIAPMDTLTLTESWTPDFTGAFRAFGRVEARGFDRALDGELVIGG